MAGAGGSSIPGSAALPVKANAVQQNAAVLPGAALIAQGGKHDVCALSLPVSNIQT